LFDDTVWNDDPALYEVSGNSIVVKENGEYSVQVSIHFVNPKQMVSPNAQLKINGTVTGPKAASGAQETVGYGDPGGTLTINEILSLSASDEIKVRMSRGSNSTEDKELELLGGVGSSYILITKIN
jgi:phage gp45-like